MNVSRAPIRLLFLALAAASAPRSRAQDVPAAPARTKPIHHPRSPASSLAPFNPRLILLDPAHGGTDHGGQISPDLLEKDVTLDFAKLLRPLLAAQGFTVVLSRETDFIPAPPPAPIVDDSGNPVPPPPPPQLQLTPDQRAELANRIHPVACLLIHASDAGSGVHLFTSSLTATAPGDALQTIPFWDTAQAALLAQSAALSADLAQALGPLRVPLLTSRASVAPIDSLTCPAVAFEIAPAAPGTPASDAAYQQRLAQALTSALVTWRSQQEVRYQKQVQSLAEAATKSQSKAPPKTQPKVPSKTHLKTQPNAEPRGPSRVTPAPRQKSQPAASPVAPIVRRPPPQSPPGAAR